MNKEILEITKKFHDIYENLSKEYCYETREDTRVFDINSSNGKLMYATVNEIVNPILKENEQLKEQIINISNYIKYRNVSSAVQQQVLSYQIELENHYKIRYHELHNNWNTLKEYLHNQIPTDKTVLTKYIKIFEVLDKMQELEQGSDDDDSNG